MAEYSSEDYALANKLNARLATQKDPALIQQARNHANRMLEYVRSEVDEYEDFVRRVHISEEFALTDSRQFKKQEKELKVIYMRASTLLEAAVEASVRQKKTG